MSQPPTGDLRLVDAARNKDLQAVRALLKQRADVNVRAHDGSTALLWAAHWNDLDTADLLIRAGADVNAANDLRHDPAVAGVHQRERRTRRAARSRRREPEHADRDRRNAAHDVRGHAAAPTPSAC